MTVKSAKSLVISSLFVKRLCLSLVFISIIGSQFIWNAENFIKQIPTLSENLSCYSANYNEYPNFPASKVLMLWLCQESKVISTSLLAPIDTIKGLLIKFRIISVLTAYSPVVEYSWSWEVAGLNKQGTWQHIDTPIDHIYDSTWSFLLNNREPKFMSSISSSSVSRQAYLKYLCKNNKDNLKAIRFYYITKNINNPLQFAQTNKPYNTKSQSLIEEFWCE